jgi:hypothetical protein
VALVECPDCRKSVSDKAAACPHCGHPIAPSPPPLPAPPPASPLTVPKARKAKPQIAGAIGCLIFILPIAAFLIWAVHEGGQIEEAEKSNPTCVSDYTKCADNDEVVNHHQSRNKSFISVECEAAAKAAARYGKPDLPFLAFHNYAKGRSFIDNGSAVLQEPNAAYRNAFNALENVVVTCTYDLKNDIASIEIFRR